MTEPRETPPGPAAEPGPLAPSEAERAQSARARGLAAPYVEGGRDPDPDRGRREERLYARLLLLMVVAIVASGFVLGVIASIVAGVGRT